MLSAAPVLALSDVTSENLALHKKVTASSYLGGYEPKYLTDGDVVSGWSPNSGVNHWAMVDLGAEYKINQVVVEMRKDYDQPETRKGFEVRASASADMSDYVVLAKQGSASIEHGGHFVGNVVDPGNYRYIQVIKTDGTYFFITEIMVYGSKGSNDGEWKAAPNFTDMKNVSENNMIQLLTLLGITSGYDDNSFKPEKSVTRAEACQMIANLLGAGGAGASQQLFTDVPISYWGAASINALYGLGAVSGMGDGTFLPEEKVTYGQFIKMLLSSLGYGDLSQLRGGYPTGYFIMAAFNGIELSETPIDKPLTRKEAGCLLYKALDVNAAKPIGVENDRVIYEADEKETVLNSVFDVYRYRGKVAATEYSALYGEKRLNRGQIRVGTETYRTAMDTFEILGRDIIYYVLEGNNTSEKILLYYETRRQDNAVTVSADDILPGSDLYSVSYYTDEEQKHTNSLSLVKTVDLYRNEQYVDNPTAGDMHPKNGKVRFVDADNDGLYDNVFVYEYESLVVNNVNVSNDELSLIGLYGNYLNLQLGSSGVRVRLTDKNDAAISAMAIEKGDVAAIYANADHSFVWVAVSGDKCSGTVEEILDDGVVINGEELEFSDSYRDALKRNMYGTKKTVIGEKVSFLLDVEGKVAAVSDEDSSLQEADIQYAYLAAADLKPGIGNNLTLMMADSTGVLKEFSCAEKMKLNDAATSHKDIESALRTSAHNGIYGQLVRYRSNASGEISAIYTSASVSPDNGIVIGDAETEYYYHSPTKALYRVSGSAAPQYFVSNNTLMFTVPRYSAEASAEMTNRKHYSVIGGSSFGNYVHYNAEAYNANQAGVAEVVVNYVKPLASDDGSDALKETHGPVLLVDQIVTAINADGETYGKLYTYVDGERKEYRFDVSAELNQFRFIGASGESKHSLKRGDVIRCSVSEDTITSAIILFRSADPMALSNGKVWDDEAVYPPVTRTIAGVVKNIYGDYMELALGDPLTGALGSFETEKYDYTKADIYIYDTKKDRLSIVSALDLPQYTYQTDSEARIFVRTSYGAPLLVLIVK